MNGSSVAAAAEIRALDARQSEGHRVTLARRVERCPDFGVAFGRTEAHDDVVGLHERFQPRFKRERKIERRAARVCPTMTGCTNSTETCCASVA